MSTVSYALRLVAVLGVLALSIGTTAFAASVNLEASGSRSPSGDPGSCVASAVHEALTERQPGTGIGSVISDIAGCARSRRA